MTTITIDRAVLEQVVSDLTHAVVDLRTALAQPEVSNDLLVSTDAGQAQTVDAQPEPVAFYNCQTHKMRWAKPTLYPEIVAVDVPELALYAAPPQPFDLNEALNKELFDTAARQAREVQK